MRSARRIWAVLSLAVGALSAPTNSFWADSSTWSPEQAETNGTAAVQALIDRRLPTEYQSIFDLQIDPSMSSNDSCHDHFLVNTTQPSGRIRVEAVNTVALSRGVLTYLRTRGGDMYFTSSTFTSKMLEASLDKSTQWEGCSWVPWRYLFNPVQFSYESVWWNWPQWEYIIDWASLHGVNLPLAIGGQEMIWMDVYRDFGMSQEDIQAYFAGPAYLSWQRLGNLHGSWGEPLSMDWIGKQWVLQKQIVARMVALGMTPVLPAFNGYIPEKLHDFIGGDNPLKAPEWGGLPSQYTGNSYLDPTWDSFKTVQSAFLQKQSQLYGGWTSHYYSIDQFHENKPQWTDPGYLQANTQNVIQSLKNVDPQAKWIMSGSMFVNDPDTWSEDNIRGLLNGASADDLIVLDMASEATPVWDKTDSYHGKKWVWNLLMNYGGVEGMYGSMWHYAEEVMRAKSNSSSLFGVGITPEAFDNNELVYEMVLDTPWTDKVIDPMDWTKNFIMRRYGMGLPGSTNGTDSIMSAWKAILPVAYNNSDPQIQGIPQSIEELSPAIDGLINRTGTHGTKLAYANRDLVTATNNLLAAAFNAPKMIDIPPYQYDMVIATRQVLNNVGMILYSQMLTEWKKTTNATGMSELGDKLLDVMADNDRVQAVNKNMLLSTFLGNARKWSDDPAEQDYLEWQARQQITTWGPAPNSTSPAWPLNRYATKQWSGLIGGLYRGSWEILVSYLKQTPPNEYNQTLIDQRVRSYELEWTGQKWGQRKNETWTTSSEDLLNIIAMLRPKWGYWFEQTLQDTG